MAPGRGAAPPRVLLGRPALACGAGDGKHPPWVRGPPAPGARAGGGRCGARVAGTGAGFRARAGPGAGAVGGSRRRLPPTFHSGALSSETCPPYLK